MNKEERFEQIERYIRGEMGPAERADFVLLLAADASLKEEVALHEGIESLARREDFLQRVSETAHDHFAAMPAQADKPRGGRRMLYWSMAAAVVLLAAIGIFVLQPARPSGQELYTAYFSPYDVPTALRSEDAIPIDADAQQAFTRYNQKDYAAAIPLFTQVLEGSSEKNTLLLFTRGICYLATGDTERAEQDFQAVVSDDDSLFVNQARWYLALTHLRAGRIQSAQTVLHTVEGAEAKVLLREIE